MDVRNRGSQIPVRLLAAAGQLGTLMGAEEDKHTRRRECGGDRDWQGSVPASPGRP